MRTLPGTAYYRQRGDMPRDLLARLDELAFRHGRTYDGYLVTEPDREYFWSANRRGVVGFYRWLKYLHVVGGLVAADEDKAALLGEFSAFCRRNRKHVTFYNITDDDAPLFRRHGFQVTKCGEEPILDLPSVTWRGRPYEWLRRQENYCLRQGVACREVCVDLADAHYLSLVVPELQEISREHLDNTAYGRELQFFEGRFDPLDLRRRRLFVAETGVDNGQTRRIEAFVVCNPADAGRMWAIEIYRRRTDAPRGVVPHVMTQVAKLLAAEGVERLSLSLCPGLRCETPLAGDSRMVRIGTGVWWRWLNWIFDLRGIYHYKSRFRPEFHNRYYAASPRLTVLSMRSCFLLWGILVPSFFGMWRHLWRKWRQRSNRALLAEPSPPSPGRTADAPAELAAIAAQSPPPKRPRQPASTE